MGNKRPEVEESAEATPTEAEGAVKHPRKRFYRARAHSNPLNDSMFDVPTSPDEVEWNEMFPQFFAKESEKDTLVRFADVGCGFGGLLINLATVYPDTLMVGMELRDKVSEYVKERILALRQEKVGSYQNISCIRTNAMKFLPNYFKKGQLTKLFFLFPDPHFKQSNHRRRIINTNLLTEYAYVLQPGGWLYTISDVPELGDWMKSKLDDHPMFEPVSEEELQNDPAAGLLTESSEEGQKVARNQGITFRNVYRRLDKPRDIQVNNSLEK
uniref:tRNA (guanine-N(7)-)-methyltransferase n=1 Tax=Polytomella parva TaxID=51329 RepID=A0A7S0YB59_9CHLO|mmetsp:Transcript_14668/g.25806  ORF Transcript_14668/g.25806 Transcript_14668/m.25806 type:complete len:270 (+) Transcript_14668:35-844(+)